MPYKGFQMTDEQKIAVITGASRRLGLFITEQLLKEGWRVHVITRAQSTGLTQLNNKMLVKHCFEDYGDGSYSRANVVRAVEDILQQESRIHLVVNNASIFEDDSKVEQKGWEVYESMMFIHMQLPALLIDGLSSCLDNTFLPGNVVSITDIYVQNPNEDFSLYCSTKAGLESLSRSYAKKLAPGIRVNVIQPGPIKFLPEHTKDQQTQVFSETLLPFEGGFLPIYQALKFILDNNYLTGVSIPVDGGRSLKRG